MCLGTQAISLLPFPMQSNLLNLRQVNDFGQVIEPVSEKTLESATKTQK
jgi:hypothetical protein